MNAEPRMPPARSWRRPEQVAVRQWLRPRHVLPVVGALLAGVMFLFIHLRPVSQADFVPLWMSAPSNASPLALPWRRQDRDALCHSGLFRVVPAPESSELTRREILQLLERLRQTRSGPVLIVYLSGYACRGAGGQAYLVPADADVDQQATWLPLRQVLAMLRQTGHRHRLLVLDVARIAETPAEDLLTEDLAAAIRDDLAAEPDPSRLVLLPCAAGQVRLCSEVLGRSLFGYYFLRGIAGEADGARGQRNGRILADELAAYVRDRVSRWASHVRLAVQEPELIGDSAGFPLVALPAGRPVPSGVPQERAYPGWLADAWAKTGSGSLQDARGRVLAAWAAERAWRAGEDDAQVQSQHQRAAADGSKSVLAATPPPLSLALAWNKPADADLIGRVDKILRELGAAAGDQPPQNDPKAREALIAGFLKSVEKQPQPAVLSAVMERAYRLAEAQADHLAILVALLDALESNPRFSETLALRRIASAMAQGELTSDIAWTLLQTLRVGEQATARPDSFAWVRQPYDEASRKRHEATVLLLETPGGAAQRRAAFLLEQSQSQFSAVLGRHADIVAALNTLQEARRSLFDVLPLLSGATFQTPEWNAALRDAAALKMELDALRGKDGCLDAGQRIPAARIVLATSLEQLVRPFQKDELDRCLLESQRGAGDAATWRLLDAILATPLPEGSTRVEVWRALTAIERQLHLEVERMPLGTLVRQPSSALTRMYPPLPPDALDSARRQAQLMALGDSDADAPLQTRLADSLTDQDRIEAAAVLRTAWRTLDNPPREGRADELWRWLADWYRYRSREYDPASPGGQFYSWAANAYQPWMPEDDGYVIIRPAAPSVSASDRSARMAVSVRAVSNRPSSEPIHFEVLASDDAPLAIAPAEWSVDWSEAASDPITRSFTASVPSASFGPLPRGVLVLARHGRRFFHASAPVPFHAPGPEIILCRAGEPPPAAVAPDIRLRPVRGEQMISMWLRNRSDQAWSGLLVEAAVEGRVVGRATADLAARETRRVLLAAPEAVTKPAKPAGDAPAGDTPANEGAGASGERAAQVGFTGPLMVRVVDSAAPGDVLSSRSVPVTVLLPGDYVDIQQAEITCKEAADRLSADLETRLRLRPSLGAPASKARVAPDVPEGTPVVVQDGAMQGLLSPAGDTLRLYAKGVVLPAPADRMARFLLQVDDWRNGLVLAAPASRPGVRSLLVREEQASLRLTLPAWGLATSAFRVPVAVYGPPSGSELRVAAGRLSGGAFEAEGMPWIGRPWSQQLGVQVHADSGALAFTAAVGDPVVTLDLSAVQGPRAILARLLDAQGRELAYAHQTIVFGDGPPAKPQFVNPPKDAWRATALSLTARGAASPVPVETVCFFVGRPADGKRPADAPCAAGKRLGGGDVLWSATLPLPADLSGPALISVEFTNVLGLSQFETITVVVKEDAAGASKAGRIQGRVLEGTVPQTGMEVVLQTSEGAPAAKTRTGADGRFVFDGVAPGKYRLSCVKTSTQRVGTAPRAAGAFLEMAPGLTVDADILLLLP